MSLTEHGTPYDFMSKDEKARYYKRNYYFYLSVYFISLLFCIGSYVGLFFANSDKILASVLCILTTLCWKETAKKYIEILNRSHNERLNGYVAIKANNWLCILLALIYPLCFLFIGVFTVVTASSVSFIIAFITIMTPLICIFLNVVTHNVLMRTYARYTKNNDYDED